MAHISNGVAQPYVGEVTNECRISLDGMRVRNGPPPAVLPRANTLEDGYDKTIDTRPAGDVNPHCRDYYSFETQPFLR